MRYLLAIACGISLLLLLSLRKNQVQVVRRYLHEGTGEVARIVEDQGSHYLVLNGEVHIPIDGHPPLSFRFRRLEVNDEALRRLSDEDFPIVIWYATDLAYERVWRVSDGRLLLDRR